MNTVHEFCERHPVVSVGVILAVTTLVCTFIKDVVTTYALHHN